MRRIFALASVIIATAILIVSLPSDSTQTYAAAAACTTSGQQRFGLGGLEVCNGVRWMLDTATLSNRTADIHQSVGATMPDLNGATRTSDDLASCRSTNAGALRFAGSTAMYCDGSNWKAFRSGGTLGTSTTATNPSIFGEPSSGLFTPGAQTVSISTSGVERVRVSSNGNVGIGTPAPSSLLTIGEGGWAESPRQAIQILDRGFATPTADNTDSAGDKLVMWNLPGTKHAIGVGPFELWFQANGNPSDHIAFFTGPTAGEAPSERMRLDANGRLGLGTSSPQAMLDVSGGVKVADDTTKCSSTNAGEVIYRGGIFYGCNGTSWAALSTATKTMVSGWPDAIKCKVSSPSRGTIIFHALSMPSSVDGLYHYRMFDTTENYDVTFNPDGTFNGHDNIASTTCDGLSINQLYTSSQAFDLTR